MSMQKKPEYWIAMAFVVIAFHFTYGLDILVPTNIRWLMEAHHDWGTHYLGWSFYRDAPWTFPIGHISDYCYPGGTNVGLTDSLVLPALLLKPFSSLLPEDFQYFGIWLLLCNVMAAHYTIKILKLYNANTVYILLGVVFVVCNPVLIYRGMHPSLCSQGFILASIYYYIKPATALTVSRINKTQVWLALIIAPIPYMWLMIIGFNIILPLKHWYYNKLIPGKKVFKYISVSVFGSILLWLVIGIISLGGANSEVHNGYGLYGFNLNSFYNSGGYSQYLPQLPWLYPHQYEGFLYLGLGLMALIILVIVYLVLSRRFIGILKNKSLIPLYVLVLLLVLFAISNRVTIDDRILFEYPLPKFIIKIGNIFRASGRFMWVAYYLVLAFVLIVFVKAKFPDWIKMPLLLLLLCLQLYDLKGLYTARQLNYGSYDSPLDEKRWNELVSQYDRIITYPPFTFTLLNPMDYQDLCFLATKNKKAISMGYAARENYNEYKKYTDSLTNAITTATLRDDELYVTTPAQLDVFGTIIAQNKMEVDYIDGYYLLYYKKKGVKKVWRDNAIEKKIDSVKTAFAGHSATKFIKVVDRVQFSNDKIKMNPEHLFISDNFVKVSGWAFIQQKFDNKGDSVFVTFSTPDKTYIALTTQMPRPDVGIAFHKGNLEDSGFSASFFTNEMGKDGILGIAIKEANNRWTHAEIGVASGLEKKGKLIKRGTLPANKGQIGNIDRFNVSGNDIQIDGWSAFDNEGSENNEIKIVFIRQNINFTIDTEKVMRPDVTEVYKNKYKYDSSGFSLIVNKKEFATGTYKVGILLKNSKTGRESFTATDKIITIP